MTAGRAESESAASSSADGPEDGPPSEQSGAPATAPNGAVASSRARDPERELATDDLLDDLSGRSVRGGAVTIVTQALKFVLMLGSTAILARILTPADFGLFAMVVAITGFVAKFKDAGLSTATIQRESVTHAQVSTLFWINVGLSLAILAVLSALAPVVAWLYGEPQLTMVTIALAGTIVLGGLTVQHQAILRRRMRFTTLAFIEIASIVSGVGAAIALALLGARYWALVAQTAAIALVNCVLVWVFSPWRPGLPRRDSQVGGMVRFGGGMSVFHLMDYAVRNLDNVLIGWWLGATPLGVYSKAYGLLMMPIRNFNAPIGGVLTPALSRLQNDPERFRGFFIRVVAGISFVTVPVVAFLFADARNAILTVLGDQWLDAVPVFRYLAPAAFFSAVNVAPTWLCLALGNSGRAMRWALVSAPLTLLAVAIALPWGIEMVALAFSLSWTPAFLAFVVYAAHRTPVRTTDIALAMAPVAGAAIVAAGGAWLISQWSSDALPPPLALLVNGAAFAPLYLGLFVLLGGLRVLPLRRVAGHLLKRRGEAGALLG